jgi:hypothetical protein
LHALRLIDAQAQEYRRVACRMSYQFLTPKKWCPRADLNHRHADFQSAALPLSYSGYAAKTAWERSL